MYLNRSLLRNDLAALCGLRLVTSIEIGRQKRLDEALVKQLTGSDTITARFLYGEFFDFRPTFKLFLAANTKPVIHGTDEGIWRRVKLVPFTVTREQMQLSAAFRQPSSREVDRVPKKKTLGSPDKTSRSNSGLGPAAARVWCIVFGA